MPPISCLKKMHDRLPSLSYSEKIIANYCIENSGNVINLSIKELASTLGIAPSTIMHFVKKIGYSGFREFKINLASEVIYDSALLDSSNTQSLTSFDEISKLNSSLLLEANNFINTNTLQSAVEAILDANKVVLFGFGTSGILAQEAYDLFYRLGINCYYNTDLHYQQLAISLMEKNDIAFIISQSGTNKATLEIAEKAIEKQISVVGICNYLKTPFSKTVTFPLCPFSEFTENHPKKFVFKIPIICLLETLYQMIYEQLGESSNEAIKKTINVAKNNSI